MSPKELLYIDDVLGHESCLRTLCSERAQQLQNSELQQLARQLSDGHIQRFSRMLSLLN